MISLITLCKIACDMAEAVEGVLPVVSMERVWGELWDARTTSTHCVLHRHWHRHWQGGDECEEQRGS